MYALCDYSVEAIEHEHRVSVNMNYNYCVYLQHLIISDFFEKRTTWY